MQELTQKPQNLKKHLGTVEISNPLSLIQRKAFSLLLYNAYQDLNEAEGKLHSISMKVFCEILGYNSNDYHLLDKEIEKLQFTKIEWIDNANEFGRVSFFAYTGRKGGQFQYSFARQLEEKLYHPEIYARINILTLSQFESRYALALYENLARYRPNKKSGFSKGSRKWTLDEFRLLMGIDNIKSYQQFKELNRKVLSPAIAEINGVSDLLVEVHKIKEGRKIVALKFEVKENFQQSLPLIPEPQTVEAEAENPIAIEMNKLYGVPLLKAGEWLIQYGNERVSEVLKMTAQKVKDGNLINPPGFITKALEEQWEAGTTPIKAKSKLKDVEIQKSAQRKKEKEAPEMAKIQKVKDSLETFESLPESEKTIHYKDFYDQNKGDWKKVSPFQKDNKFPLVKGENPANSENGILVLLWEEYISNLENI